jgi:hypothetical protein
MLLMASDVELGRISSSSEGILILNRVVPRECAG